MMTDALSSLGVDVSTLSDAELARILQEEEEEISRQDRNRRRANNRIDEDANFAAALVSLDEDELLKSPEESADEDFLLAWQLQEHETQAARIRAQQQHQTQLRHSLSPTHKYEKVVSQYRDSAALDVYYASEDHNKNNRDKHYLNDGDEDFEDDYQDEDQKEMQRRGMSLAKVVGMKPNHLAAKPQGRQSPAKFNKQKQQQQQQQQVASSSPIKVSASPPKSNPRVPKPPVSASPPAQKPPSPKEQEPTIFEDYLDDEGDDSDNSDVEIVPGDSHTGAKPGGSGAKARRTEKVETLNPTSSAVLDGRTRLKLQKVVNEGLFDTLGGVVSVGKEASVFHAENAAKREFAVKIFKTTLSEFRDREQYLVGEWRFRHETSKQLSTHKLIKLWAEKELRNLKRLYSAGIPVPEPIALKGHIVIMEFIGSKSRPAPQLAKVRFEGVTPAESGSRWEDMYMQVLHLMRDLYQKARLVHADLSEWNMLLHGETVILIDTAQAVESEHPNALLFLRRDCQNISNFFRKRGVKHVLTTRQAFNLVTENFPEANFDDLVRNQRKENSRKSQQELSNDEQIQEAVFLNSFIPRTLRQVHDPIGEIETMQNGGDISRILHSTVTGVGIDGFFSPDGSYQMHEDDAQYGEEAVAEEDEEEEDDDEDHQHHGDSDEKPSGPKPRKGLTKEERKQQRKDVKAQRREARQNKHK